MKKAKKETYGVMRESTSVLSFDSMAESNPRPQNNFNMGGAGWEGKINHGIAPA